MKRRYAATADASCRLTASEKHDGGGYSDACKECIREKHLATRASHHPQQLALAYSDPEFDGQTIGDVFRLMGRAKHWLESRGCTIKLEGEYIETRTHKLKY